MNKKDKFWAVIAALVIVLIVVTLLPGPPCEIKFLHGCVEACYRLKDPGTTGHRDCVQWCFDIYEELSKGE